MLLEEMIHAFWRDSTSLCTAVPLERVLTGTAMPVPTPCVFLVHEKEEILFHTNRGEPWKKIVLRFELHHESFEEGARIAHLIERSFHRLRLSDPGEGLSFQCGFKQGETRQDKSGLWIFIRRFHLLG